MKEFPALYSLPSVAEAVFLLCLNRNSLIWADLTQVLGSSWYSKNKPSQIVNLIIKR